MAVFENAKWIWHTACPKADEYGEFHTEFEYSGGDCILNISADSNYAVYVNGELAAFGQYADYPHDKIYDSVDISKFCRSGKNSFAVICWYYGIETTAVYYLANAGLIFEIVSGGKAISCSSEQTLSRMSRAYRNHVQKSITPQLGFSFHYDATCQDDWISGNADGFLKSSIVDQNLPLRVRPNKKLELLPVVKGKLIKKISECDLLFDLGEEQVGFISLDFVSDTQQEIVIAYGEHIVDGNVRQIIGPRDFSVIYTAKKGENKYTNPFRRLGCRYLEVKSQAPIKTNCIGIEPTVYPLKHLKKPELTGIENDIYDICVNTLRLCMHEHYEDCPWREQGLYTMDSRNQMLCGYYAFGEYEFARSSLQLISRDSREDGLISICCPKSAGKVIPSFSLHYVTQVLEYYNYSKDISLVKEVMPKIHSVLKVFINRLEGGLILPFPSPSAWDFYEWNNCLDGKKTDLNAYDLPLNALLSIALKKAGLLCEIIGEQDIYSGLCDNINEAIHKKFYSKERGVYLDIENADLASVLSNSLAILCGAAQGHCKEIAAAIEKDESLTRISLSMLCFKYDAYLQTDASYYKQIILDEIRTIYSPMVKFGNKTVWETEKGDGDFGNAGSLCHGWSALPVYYYNILR